MEMKLSCVVCDHEWSSNQTNLRDTSQQVEWKCLIQSCPLPKHLNGNETDFAISIIHIVFIHCDHEWSMWLWVKLQPKNIHRHLSTRWMTMTTFYTPLQHPTDSDSTLYWPCPLSPPPVRLPSAHRSGPWVAPSPPYSGP